MATIIHSLPAHFDPAEVGVFEQLRELAEFGGWDLGRYAAEYTARVEHGDREALAEWLTTTEVYLAEEGCQAAAVFFNFDLDRELADLHREYLADGVPGFADEKEYAEMVEVACMAVALGWPDDVASLARAAGLTVDEARSLDPANPATVESLTAMAALRDGAQ